MGLVDMFILNQVKMDREQFFSPVLHTDRVKQALFRAQRALNTDLSKEI